MDWVNRCTGGTSVLKNYMSGEEVKWKKCGLGECGEAGMGTSAWRTDGMLNWDSGTGNWAEERPENC